VKQLRLTVPEEYEGKRLDAFLSEEQTLLSRSQIQKAIREKRVWVNGENLKASYKICAADTIELEGTAPVPLQAESENIPLDILYEDSSIIVVNKSVGMVVHPACGNHSGTLVNALLYHCKTLSGIGGVIRPGIVHRLDKGTSGVLVVAKNDQAHQSLSEQFKEHTVVRKYTALVFGAMDEPKGRIESLIGRHPSERKKMCVYPKKGRHAVTHWQVKESFDMFSLLSVTLETGRTHQVRVHLSSIGHPVVVDPVYCSTKKILTVSSKRLQDALKSVKRPLLHAGSLTFLHPEKKSPLTFEVPMTDDFSHVLTLLRGDSC